MVVLSEAATLARDLVRLNTTNPPGHEARAARHIADHLARSGIRAELHPLADGREGLIARIAGTEEGGTLCFSGHLDTVPIGTERWTHDPFAGLIEGDRLWGRGACDMKGGVAAMVVAFERLHRHGQGRAVTLVLTASEETGCQGAASLADKIGPADALLIAEPTSERVVIGHKGVVWLRLSARGKAAHASRPDLGNNAIQQLMDALRAVQGADFGVAPHELLGPATSSLGTIHGGVATNIVPDESNATLDIRLIPGMTAAGVRDEVQRLAGRDILVEEMLSLGAVHSPPGHPWIASLCDETSRVCGVCADPMGATIFTDASVLAPALGNPLVALIGPGDPALAHQRDEWCSVSAIDRVTDLYERLARTFGACGE